MAMMKKASEQERALEEVTSLVASVDEKVVVRPQTDPHAAAVTALLVADYLQQPVIRDKLDGAASENLVRLRRLARALLAVLADLGGEYLTDAVPAPVDLVERGKAVRTEITTTLEDLLRDDADVKMSLEAIRLGSDIVDLAYDLRSLAELCGRHARTSAASGATHLSPFVASAALFAADALELALRKGESPETARARDTIARLWTLFVPAYNQAASIGRIATGATGDGRFPPLAIVTARRRARRPPLSLVPPSLVEATLEEVTPPDAATRNPSLPPSRRRSLAPSSQSGLRTAKRHTVEIEVGIASDSNLYLGFTENLSASGVFVATYAPKPLGERVEIALAFANGDELRVPGVVRWLRDATPDAWPGMGLQFEALSVTDEEKLRKFLSLRDPLFYDD